MDSDDDEDDGEEDEEEVQYRMCFLLVQTLHGYCVAQLTQQSTMYKYTKQKIHKYKIQIHNTQIQNTQDCLLL